MKIGNIYDIIFTTNRADTGALADADSTPIVRILEDSSLMPYIPPVTNIGTGKYVVTIDTEPDENGFSSGQRYAVYATATVNGIEGAIGLDHFVGEIRGVDDILPTTTYAAPYTPLEVREELETSTILAMADDIPTVGDIRTELSPELALINLNLDAKVSEAGGGGGGGGLTTEEHAHLMKLRNGGGGAMINYESIEKGLAKDRKWLYEKIGEIPGLIAGSEGRVIDAVGLVNTTISNIMDSKDTEALAESMGNLAKETAKATELANQVAIESKRKSEKLTHTLETKILEDEIKEETKELKEAHEKKVDQEVKALEVDAQIQDEVQKLAQDAQIQDEIKSLESNF